MQKETDHYYTAVTEVDLDATTPTSEAGIYLTDGSEKVVAKLFTGYEQDKKITFELDTARRSIPNKFGNRVWLKLERNQHLLRAWCSGDGQAWTPVGMPVDAAGLDKTQPNYNSWVGTSVGLFAEGQPADFNCFICKDGTSAMPAVGYSNYYCIMTLNDASGKSVTNTSDYGGWLMLSGVELGNRSPSAISVLANAKVNGQFEIWVDDLQRGKLIAKIPFNRKLGWRYYRCGLKWLTGQHDVFVKFPAKAARGLVIKSIPFLN